MSGSHPIIVASGLSGSTLDAADVRIVEMPPLMQRVLADGVSAITLGTTVFLRPDRYRQAVAGGESELIAHELVHVEQWREYGAVGFLRRYLLDYARLRMIGLTHNQAYRGIGFEHEAYTRAKRMDRII